MKEEREGERVSAVGWLSSLANPRRVCVLFLATRTRAGSGKTQADGGGLAVANTL